MPADSCAVSESLSLLLTLVLDLARKLRRVCCCGVSIVVCAFTKVAVCDECYHTSDTDGT